MLLLPDILYLFMDITIVLDIRACCSNSFCVSWCVQYAQFSESQEQQDESQEEQDLDVDCTIGIR